MMMLMLTSKAMEHYGRRMAGLCHQRLLVPFRAFSASLSFLRDEGGACTDPSPTPPASPRRSVLPSLMLPPDFVSNHRRRQERRKKEEEEGDYLYCFYSLEEKKIGGVKKDKQYSMLFPWEKDLFLPHDARCVGSSHGWLAYVVPRSSSSSPLYLFRYPPLSAPDFFSPSSMIRLPPIETFPTVTGVRVRKSGGSGVGVVTREYIVENEFDEDESVFSVQFMTALIKKLVLSSAPPAFTTNIDDTGTTTGTNSIGTGTSSCIAMAIFESQHLVFCRLGDESWTCLDRFKPYPGYQDVIYSRSDRVFYALSISTATSGSQVDYFGVLDCWDLSDPATPRRTALIEAFVCESPHSEWEADLRELNCSSQAYLVESEGELLMVRRFWTWALWRDGILCPNQRDWSDHRYNDAGFRELIPYKTVRFDVYRLDSAREEWKPLRFLGHRALFLGLNHSFSLSVADYPQLLRGNSIYFTDEQSIDDCGGTYSCAGKDMGIYHMEDNSIEPHCPCDANIIHPPPVWVAPS